MTRLERFIQDSKAQSGADQAVNVVVGLVVAALTAAFLIPIGIEELVNVSTSNWSSGAASLWGILDVIIVLAVFLIMINMAVNRT
jgi:hypothetical protein